MVRLDLAAVIVTFNTRDLLLQCLQSVLRNVEQAGRTHRVIVVDNASTDGTAAAVRAAYPSVHLIENTTNVGPARAFNQGLAACPDATYVLLMNSDIKVPPGTLGAMTHHLERHPQVAGVSVRLINPDGSPQKFRTSVGISLWPQRLDRITPITFFGTTFHLARRVLYDVDEVGPFDERYYFFNEDLDWSIRAHRKGVVFHYLAHLAVVHHVGQGRTQNRDKILGDLYRANLYLYAKFYGRWVTRLVYLAQMAAGLAKLGALRLAGRQASSEAVAYRSALDAQRRFMRHDQRAMETRRS